MPATLLSSHHPFSFLYPMLKEERMCQIQGEGEMMPSVYKQSGKQVSGKAVSERGSNNREKLRNGENRPEGMNMYEREIRRG